jgi:hypothetical protein
MKKSNIKKLQRQRSIISEVTLHERPTSKTYNNTSTEITSGAYHVGFDGEQKAFTRKMGKGLRSLPEWIHVSVN